VSARRGRKKLGPPLGDPTRSAIVRITKAQAEACRANDVDPLAYVRKRFLDDHGLDFSKRDLSDFALFSYVKESEEAARVIYHGKKPTRRNALWEDEEGKVIDVEAE